MRCLLDKVTARYTIQGLLKLAEGRDLSEQEMFTLDLLERASAQQIDLFIAPPTLHVVQQIMQLPQYTALIQFFLDQVQVVFPTRYFKRWARRLREYQFSREDAAILALATFGTDAQGSILSMSVVATYDQPMITETGDSNYRVSENSLLPCKLTCPSLIVRPFYLMSFARNRWCDNISARGNGQIPSADGLKTDCSTYDAFDILFGDRFFGVVKKLGGGAVFH